MAINLTAGAISMISTGEWQTVDLKPVLQVMDVKIVPQTPTSGVKNPERFRVILSDGSFHQYGMLATQNNDLVTSQQLQKGSIVQLTEFVCITTGRTGRIVVIIINLNVILGNCDIIGDAKPFPLVFPTSQIKDENNKALNLITVGAISMISTGECVKMDLKPVLQVMDIRITVKDRYLVLLSDGSFHQQGFLSTQYNDLVTSQQLQKGSIVQLTNFFCTAIREHIIIFVIDLNVILQKRAIIGNTKPFVSKLCANENPSMATPTALTQSSVPMSAYSLKTVSNIKDEKLGTFQKPDYITVKAAIWSINLENFCYMACPIMLGDKKCSSKVVNNEDGKWLCEKCDETVDECDSRYILKLQIRDHTGMTWMTAFEEMGEEIMGVNARDLLMMNSEDYERSTEIVHGVMDNEYLFKLKVKKESWNYYEQRVKCSVVKAEKVNYSASTNMRFLEIEKMREDSGGADRAAPSGFGQHDVLPVNQAGQFNSGVNLNGGNGGGPGECYKRRKTGHWARDCPGVTEGVSSYGVSAGGGNGECWKCHQSGH